MQKPAALCISTEYRMFKLRFSTLTEAEIAHLVASTIRSQEEGVGLIITPNIQHISLLRKTPALRQACQNAAFLTCDGFPLYYYGKWHDLPVPGRVTGRGIVSKLMAQPEQLAHHRLFMVLDSERTVAAAQAWAARHGLTDKLDCVVPRMGFCHYPDEMATLADRIKAHGTTLLFMGVGAPQSELFVNQYRAQLPPCWALCIGQALLVAFGLLPTPPNLVQRLNLEWLWRIILEPRRMLKRNIFASYGFLYAILLDQLWCKGE